MDLADKLQDSVDLILWGYEDLFQQQPSFSRLPWEDLGISEPCYPWEPRGQKRQLLLAAGYSMDCFL